MADWSLGLTGTLGDLLRGAALPRSLSLSLSPMEEDVLDKLEDMASVQDFDPLTGSIPATKVELTVSCR